MKNNFKEFLKGVLTVAIITNEFHGDASQKIQDTSSEKSNKDNKNKKSHMGW